MENITASIMVWTITLSIAAIMLGIQFWVTRDLPREDKIASRKSWALIIAFCCSPSVLLVTMFQLGLPTETIFRLFSAGLAVMIFVFSTVATWRNPEANTRLKVVMTIGFALSSLVIYFFCMIFFAITAPLFNW
jgi:hypothetical protein